MKAHLIFNGPERKLKMFLQEKDDAPPDLRHTIEAHDVGIRDGMDPDTYGHECKCPPGVYVLGAPQDTPGEAGYGEHFTPLIDTPGCMAMQKHGRAGIGIHGGGSTAPDPFAPKQGFFSTLGCIRVLNEDNDNIFVPFVRYVQAHGGEVLLTVFW